MLTNIYIEETKGLFIISLKLLIQFYGYLEYIYLKKEKKKIERNTKSFCVLMDLLIVSEKTK